MWKSPSITVLLSLMTCVISFNLAVTAPLIKESAEFLPNPKLDNSREPSSRPLGFVPPAISPTHRMPQRVNLQRSQKFFTSVIPSFPFKSTPIQTPATEGDLHPVIKPKKMELSSSFKQPFQSLSRQSKTFPPIPDLPPPPESKSCRDRPAVGNRDEPSGEGQLPVIPDFPEIPRWMPRSASHKVHFGSSSAERVYTGVEVGTSRSNQTNLQ